MNRQLRALANEAGIVVNSDNREAFDKLVELLLGEVEKTCDELIGRRIGEVDPLLVLKGRLGLK